MGLLSLAYVAIAIGACKAVANRSLSIASNVLPECQSEIVGPVLAHGGGGGACMGGQEQDHEMGMD